jgi:hypothetical protein
MSSTFAPRTNNHRVRIRCVLPTDGRQFKPLSILAPLERRFAWRATGLNFQTYSALPGQIMNRPLCEVHKVLTNPGAKERRSRLNFQFSAGMSQVHS